MRCGLFIISMAVFLVFAASAGAIQQTDSEKAMHIMEQMLSEGWPSVLDLIGASQNSIPLFRSYCADSFQAVIDDVFQNMETERKAYELSPCPGTSYNIDYSYSTNAVGARCNESRQVMGFRVEIDGAGGKEADNAWESVEGGSLIIEVVETTVGSDQFNTSEPGHRYFEDINLSGPMAKNRKDLSDWINNKTKGKRENLSIATLSFYDQYNNPIREYNFSVLDFYYFRNEMLMLTADDAGLHAMVLTVSRTDSKGSAFSGQPKIITIQPSSGSAFMPVAIGGINFGEGAIPYFNDVPSIALFSFSTQNIPLIGTMTVGVTIVPPAAPSGHGAIVLEYMNQTSNPFPFTVQ